MIIYSYILYICYKQPRDIGQEHRLPLMNHLSPLASQLMMRPSEYLSCHRRGPGNSKEPHRMGAPSDVNVGLSTPLTIVIYSSIYHKP